MSFGASPEQSTFNFNPESTHPSEKTMAPHSSTLAWKIPWMKEPGGLKSMGSLQVGHDWATSLSFFTYMHWRRKWQPTPVFLPGESQGRESLVGCRLWGRTEWDTTEATWQQQQQQLIPKLCWNFLLHPHLIIRNLQCDHRWWMTWRPGPLAFEAFMQLLAPVLPNPISTFLKNYTDFINVTWWFWQNTVHEGLL